MNKIIDIRNITAGYGDKIVLRDVNLSLYENDFLGIIGPNGGGKTTLLKVILGLLSPVRGEISFFNNEQKVNQLKIGYLPQLNQIDKKFPISVKEVITSGLAAQKPRPGRYNQQQLERITEVIGQMGLDELADRPIGELSGGQLQRVLLGRSIVADPQLLILDEPNSYVDKRFESHFYELLEEINKRSAIILVSHDIGTVLRMVKNIACVNETLHYHSGSDVSADWLDDKYACPIELIGHGEIPHRVLKDHTHCHNTTDKKSHS
ncbi:MAG: ABC transporter ATP-binding protein [Tannerellaceae bacterium]|nr:ABC transporter ATP-binding protein [Tannerellaceae bacterium]